MNALETMGEYPKGCRFLFRHIITTKLNTYTIKFWKTLSLKEKVPPIKMLVKFSEKSFKIIEASVIGYSAKYKFYKRPANKERQ